MANLSALHKTSAGRNLLLAQEIWKWVSDPLIELTKEMTNENGSPIRVKEVVFMVPNISPITVKTRKHVNALVDVLIMAITDQKKKHKLFDEDDRVQVFSLLSIVVCLLLDTIPIWPTWKKNAAFMASYQLVSHLQDVLYGELEEEQREVADSAVGRICEWIWWQHKQLDGVELFWYNGKNHPNYEAWLGAVREHRSTIQKEEQ